MACKKRYSFPLARVVALTALFVLAVPLYAQGDERKRAPGPACRPYLEYDLEFDNHDPGNIADCVVEMRTHDYQLAQTVYKKVLSIVPEDPSYMAKAFRSGVQPIFLRAAIAAEFNQACDSFRERSQPNPYLPNDGSFDEFDKIIRWIERMACGMELEERRPVDFMEMAGYLAAIVDAGLVPELDDVYGAEDGAYFDAAVRFALTNSLIGAESN